MSFDAPPVVRNETGLRLCVEYHFFDWSSVGVVIEPGGRHTATSPFTRATFSVFNRESNQLIISDFDTETIPLETTTDGSNFMPLSYLPPLPTARYICYACDEIIVSRVMVKGAAEFYKTEALARQAVAAGKGCIRDLCETKGCKNKCEKYQRRLTQKIDKRPAGWAVYDASTPIGWGLKVQKL